MEAWAVLAFGLLLVGLAAGSVRRERVAAKRGRRPFREDLRALVAMLLVIGGVAVLLGLAMLLVFPRH